MADTAKKAAPAASKPKKVPKEKKAAAAAPADATPAKTVKRRPLQRHGRLYAKVR